MSDNEKTRRWIEVQKKAFLHWVNTFLQRQDTQIDDILTGFSDGVKLILFLEELTGKKINQRYSKNPTLKAYKITNCFIALKHLENLGVRGLTIAAEDIVDADERRLNLILGFCWMLLREFQQVPMGDDDEGRTNPIEERLLDWVRSVLQGYSDIEVIDFSSFNDGRALLALLEQFDSDLVNYTELDLSDPYSNCELALNLAEDGINIPQLLEPDELANGEASDKNMLLYLTLLYNAFQEKLAVHGEQSLLQQIEELRAENERLRGENDVFKTKNVTLEENNVSLTTNLESVTTEKNEIEAQAERARDDWLKEREELLSRIAELEEEIDALKSSSDESVQQLQSQKDRISKERDSLRKDKENLESELEELGENFTKLNKKFSKQQKAKAELEEFLETTQRDTAVTLAALRKHLLQHVEDVNVWKVFLEHDTRYESELIQILKEDEIHDLPFPEQIASLDDEIQKENDRLAELLEERVREKTALEAVAQDHESPTSIEEERPSEPEESSDASGSEPEPEEGEESGGEKKPQKRVKSARRRGKEKSKRSKRRR